MGAPLHGRYSATHEYGGRSMADFEALEKRVANLERKLLRAGPGDVWIAVAKSPLGARKTRRLIAAGKLSASRVGRKLCPPRGRRSVHRGEAGDASESGAATLRRCGFHDGRGHCVGGGERALAQAEAAMRMRAKRPWEHGASGRACESEAAGAAYAEAKVHLLAGRRAS